MIDALRNLHALGVPFERAVGAATEVPARLLGRKDLGVLEPEGLNRNPGKMACIDQGKITCSGQEHCMVRTI